MGFKAFEYSFWEQTEIYKEESAEIVGRFWCFKETEDT